MKFEYHGQVMSVNSREAQGKLFNNKNFGEKNHPIFQIQNEQVGKNDLQMLGTGFHLHTNGCYNNEHARAGPIKHLKSPAPG